MLISSIDDFDCRKHKGQSVHSIVLMRFLSALSKFLRSLSAFSWILRLLGTLSQFNQHFQVVISQNVKCSNCHCHSCIFQALWEYWLLILTTDKADINTQVYCYLISTVGCPYQQVLWLIAISSCWMSLPAVIIENACDNKMVQ